MVLAVTIIKLLTSLTGVGETFSTSKRSASDGSERWSHNRSNGRRISGSTKGSTSKIYFLRGVKLDSKNKIPSIGRFTLSDEIRRETTIIFSEVASRTSAKPMHSRHSCKDGGDFAASILILKSSSYACSTWLTAAVSSRRCRLGFAKRHIA